MRPPGADHGRKARQGGLTADDLWVHYYGSGGHLGVFELDAYLHGMYPLPQGERNAIALALNELIDDLPRRPKAEFVHIPPLDHPGTGSALSA